MFKKVLIVTLLSMSCVNAELHNISVINNKDNSKNLVIDDWIVCDSNSTTTCYGYTDNNWNIFDNNMDKISDVKNKENFDLFTLTSHENQNKKSNTNNNLWSVAGNFVKDIIVNKASKKITKVILDNNNINTVTNYITKAVDLYAGTSYNKAINDAKKKNIFNLFWGNSARKKVEQGVANVLNLGLKYSVKYIKVF